jgi:hypothetical protein
LAATTPSAKRTIPSLEGDNGRVGCGTEHTVGLKIVVALAGHIQSLPLRNCSLLQLRPCWRPDRQEHRRTAVSKAPDQFNAIAQSNEEWASWALGMGKGMGRKLWSIKYRYISIYYEK